MRKILALVLIAAFLLTSACSGYSETVSETYRYEVSCPERHVVPFYANSYSTDRGVVILYDAYIFELGWRQTDVYRYPIGAVVSIKDRGVR